MKKKKIKAKLVKIEKKLAKTKSKLTRVLSELDDAQKTAKRPSRPAKSRIAPEVWEPAEAAPIESDGIRVEPKAKAAGADDAG